MKSIRFNTVGGPEVLQVQDVDKPIPTAGQILIRVDAAGVNFADIAQREGRYLTPTQLPSSLGVEIAGVVDELGPRVSGRYEGERVMALLSKPEGYGEYVVAPASAAIPLPDDADPAESLALLVQGLSAYFILQDSARLQSGETVLINAAAGGVGSLTVQLAQLLEAGMVIGTASSPEKLDAIRGLGADAAIDYHANPDFSATVLELTRNKGVDVVLESVGGSVFDESFSSLAKFGRMVVYGNSSRQPPNLDPRRLMSRNQSIIGFWLVNLLSRPGAVQSAIQTLLDYYIHGDLVVDVQSFPLTDAADAHRQIEARQTRGKVVLRP